MSIDFSASLEAQSLAELTRLQGFSALLRPEITTALTQAGQLLVTTAQDNTWRVFERPTGQLAESIYFYVASPMEVQVRVGVPYGRRREYGFSGMTDALGRYYANDPGKPYLEPAVTAHTQTVQELIREAVDAALGRSTL